MMCCVVGCVSGPMTLATQLLGMEKALYLAVDEPEQFADLMDFATEVVLGFGIAQIEAGAICPLFSIRLLRLTSFRRGSSPRIRLPHLEQLFTAF